MFYLKKNSNKKPLIEQQINVWIAWERRKAPYGMYLSEYESWLIQFSKFNNTKSDVCDITDDDVVRFINHLRDIRDATWWLSSAEKAIRSIRRFYTARGKKLSPK
jgi:site-specific recombinase XerD